MAESATRPRLFALPWALGTFHTVALVLILIWLVYPGGGLASLLASLGTVAGIVVFLALWGATLFTTRRALAGLDWISDEAVVMGTFFWRPAVGRCDGRAVPRLDRSASTGTR